MCRRDCSTAICWNSLISTGSTRLKTPPTPASRASSSLTWPSESSWICCSFSSSVILREQAVDPLLDVPARRAGRVGASAASSVDCVAATTPPATAVLATTATSPASILPLRVFMPLPL